jgi:3-methyladenine DNA glycosylase AlkD
MKLSELRKQIKKNASPKRAEVSKRFFKTKKGEYGEGDYFLGVAVPELRRFAKNSIGLDFGSLEKLLNSKWHEERFVALAILAYQFRDNPKEVFEFYLKNLSQINNWDLVDVSADKIIGAYSFQHLSKAKTKKLLIKLAKSENLWERRIAIIACFHFIRKNDFDYVLLLSKILMADEHDLIHKAIGWMLREVGKRNKKILVGFLSEHKTQMARTMLRYAIEKFPQEERKKILRTSFI